MSINLAPISWQALSRPVEATVRPVSRSVRAHVQGAPTLCHCGTVRIYKQARVAYLRLIEEGLFSSIYKGV